MYFVDTVVSYDFVLLCSELISFSLCLLLCMSTMLVNKVDHYQNLSQYTYPY